MRAAALLVVAAGIAACSSDPPPSGTECRVARDCDPGEQCVAGRCIDEGIGVDLDAGTMRDGPPLVLLDGGETRDATQADASAPDATNADATNPDATNPDATNPDALTPDALTPDARAPDASALDAWSADAPATDAGTDAESDAGPEDAAPFHFDATASNPDATPPDTGPIDAGPPARGAYDFRRIIVPGIVSNRELTHLSLSPDDRTLLASERYDAIHAIDVATETTTRSVVLPKDSNEPIMIEAIAQSPSFVLIAATAFLGPMNNPEGRLYRTDSFLRGLIEVGNRRAGRAFHNVSFDAQTGDALIIGEQELTSAYLVTLERWVDATSSHTLIAQDIVSAGCQDLAIAADGLGGRGIVFTCGINGAVVGVYDSTDVFSYGGIAGNTSNLAARPGEDYALAVSWSGGRLSRFDNGVWTIGFGAPSLSSSSVWNIAFNSDGRRALITGQYTGSVATLREYRDGYYSTAEITDVSIPNFNLAPWLGASGVILDDVVWSSSGDCGFLSGGCSSFSCTRGYLIAFEVINGRPCP